MTAEFGHPSGLNDRQKVARMIDSYIMSQLIGIAAKLDLADKLSAGPKSIDDLAGELGIESPILLRLLRGFVMCELIRERADRQFELAPLGEWLKSDSPGSLHALAVRTHDVYYPAWGALIQAVVAGETAFNIAFGREFFRHISDDSASAASFARLMSSMCSRRIGVLVSSYDFSAGDHIVDVGGGEGVLLAEILKTYPTKRGTLFDIQPVLVGAYQRLQSCGLANRCAVVSGDFLCSVPPLGDIYILKHVLHNWSDLECVRILRNCRDAMGARASLLVIESVINRWSVSAVHSDLRMLVLNGGAERTEDGFKDLFARSGLRLNRAVPVGREEQILEIVPG